MTHGAEWSMAGSQWSFNTDSSFKKRLLLKKEPFFFALLKKDNPIKNRNREIQTIQVAIENCAMH